MAFMHELNGIKAIWLREFIRFRRQRSRILTSIIQPLLWLFLFGAGFSSIANVGNGIDYQAYLFPGIIGITVLFTSIFFGVSIIWDRQFGFLKEIMVAPLSRISIFFGKALGGTTTSMIQGTLILLIGLALNLNMTPERVLLILPVMFLLSLTIVSLGLIMGSMMESFEGFNLIMTFINMPMFFLSGALFPVDDLPAFLKPLSIANPMTYAVDAFRGILIGINATEIWIDVAILAGFCILFLGVGAYIFSRRK
ncbi:MAG: ABC transporter permease [Candidatus Micrarchaeota archaeon]